MMLAELPIAMMVAVVARSYNILSPAKAVATLT
jgi:hypothetical protein